MATLGIDLSHNAGTNYGTQKTNSYTNEGADILQTYGGSTDTWGRTWTPAELNDTNFRARLELTIVGETETMEADHIKIRVFYRPKIVLAG